jgi:putative ABC transport system permease protein
MKKLIIAFRSFFKKGRGSLIKIISLGVGLAVGMALIAKVYFEQTYDDFFPYAARIYQIRELILRDGELKDFPQVSGAVAPGMQAEIAEVEVAISGVFLKSIQ